MFGIFKTIAQKPKTVTGGIAAIGTAGLLAYQVLLMPWEGNVLKPYLDVGGVPTACMGITGPNITEAYHEGRVFTVEECNDLNIAAVIKHEKRVNKALKVSVNDTTKAAFISFDFNTGRFPTSTMVKLANQGNLRAACEEMPRWVFVKGVKVKGLENRRFLGDATRISERTLCLIGLDPSYKTPLYEKLYVQYRTWLSGFGGRHV